MTRRLVDGLILALADFLILAVLLAAYTIHPWLLALVAALLVAASVRHLHRRSRRARRLVTA